MYNRHFKNKLQKKLAIYEPNPYNSTFGNLLPVTKTKRFVNNIFKYGEVRKVIRSVFAKYRFRIYGRYDKRELVK